MLRKRSARLVLARRLLYATTKKLSSSEEEAVQKLLSRYRVTDPELQEEWSYVFSYLKNYQKGTLTDLEKLLKLKIDPSRAFDLLLGGYSVDEIVEGISKGFIKFFARRRITSEDEQAVRKFLRSIGIINPDLQDEWELIYEYLSNYKGITSLSELQKLIDVGLTPSQAYDLLLSGYTIDEIVEGIKEGFIKFFAKKSPALKAEASSYEALFYELRSIREKLEKLSALIKEADNTGDDPLEEFKRVVTRQEIGKVPEYTPRRSKLPEVKRVEEGPTFERTPYLISRPGTRYVNLSTGEFYTKNPATGEVVPTGERLDAAKFNAVKAGFSQIDSLYKGVQELTKKRDTLKKKLEKVKAYVDLVEVEKTLKDITAAYSKAVVENLNLLKEIDAVGVIEELEDLGEKLIRIREYLYTIERSGRLVTEDVVDLIQALIRKLAGILESAQGVKLMLENTQGKVEKVYEIIEKKESIRTESRISIGLNLKDIYEKAKSTILSLLETAADYLRSALNKLLGISHEVREAKDLCNEIEAELQAAY